jgi:hypothetical protein
VPDIQYGDAVSRRDESADQHSIMDETRWQQARDEATGFIVRGRSAAG